MDAQIQAKLLEIMRTKNFEKQGVIGVRCVRLLQDIELKPVSGVRLGVISNTFSNTSKQLKTIINQIPNTSNTSNTYKNTGLKLQDYVDEAVYQYEAKSAELEICQGMKQGEAEPLAFEFVCTYFMPQMPSEIMPIFEEHYHNSKPKIGYANG